MTAQREDLLEELVSTGLWLGASDIHFDPEGDALRLVFRIHGRLVAVDTVSHLPGETGKAILQRLKVLARMSLGDQRKAQDGHLQLETARGTCDLRVATVPTVAGERAVVRLFPQGDGVRRLHDLGMSRSLLHAIHDVVMQGTGGIVLVAGKIGAGKSTTLHALLWEYAGHGVSVMTIEDPVERRVCTYHQMAVDERQGWTFSECLRAALRQDPDWLMIGEIRDEQTAQIAVRAGMTGHMIAATVHADDPRQALLRLVELGVSPRLVGEAVRMVIWQRLCRVQCEHCQGSGCVQCLGVGVTGRRAEFLSLDHGEVRHVLHAHGRVRAAVPAEGVLLDQLAQPLLRLVPGSRLPRTAKRGAMHEAMVVAEGTSVFADYGGTSERSE